MAEKKYQKYILREPKAPPPVRKKADETAMNISEDMMKQMGKKFNVNFQFVGKLNPHVLFDPPHKHDQDELLFFIPANPDIAPDLGGVVEVALGDEWEKQTVTTAAIIVIPPGINHAPIFVRKVTHPFYFGHCLLAPHYVSNETANTILEAHY